MNIKIITRLLLIVGSAFFGEQVLAEGDSLFRARAHAGLSSYALTLTGAGSEEPDATSNYLSAGVGLTYATGNIYIDFAYSQSINAEHDWPGFEGEFERTDTATTVGYLLNGGWSAFGGYKYGRSDFYRDSRPGYKLTFEAYGLFGGVSKSIILKNGSSVLLSGAVAFMTGDVYDNNTLDDSGSAIGTSFAAAYNLPIGNDSGLQLRGSYQYYSFTEFNSPQLDAVETIFSADAAYYLNF